MTAAGLLWPVAAPARSRQTFSARRFDKSSSAPSRLLESTVFSAGATCFQVSTAFSPVPLTRSNARVVIAARNLETRGVERPEVEHFLPPKSSTFFCSSIGDAVVDAEYGGLRRVASPTPSRRRPLCRARTSSLDAPMPIVATTAGLSRPYCFRSLRSSGRSFRAVICADCSCPSSAVDADEICGRLNRLHELPVLAAFSPAGSSARPTTARAMSPWSGRTRARPCRGSRRSICRAAVSREVSTRNTRLPVGKLRVHAGARGRFLAEQNSLRLFLAIHVERDVDARLGQAVRLQVGSILVDNSCFFEVRQVRHDFADAVAIGRRLDRLNDRPRVVRRPCEARSPRRCWILICT